jgi:hypothetical protein
VSMERDRSGNEKPGNRVAAVTQRPPGLRIDTAACTVTELLAGYGGILEELRQRGIVRSSNSPVSDYAELLFCTAFGWRRENNSAAGHDATGRMGSGIRSRADA